VLAYNRFVTKTRALGLAGSFALVLTIFVVLPSVGADEKDGKGSVYRPLGLFTEVLSLVRSNYVEPVELKPLLSGAFAGMTEAMDPFAEYVPPEKLAAFNAAMAAKEKRESVDAGLVLAKRFGYPMVVAAIAGSPAALAGIKSDDVIEKIGNEHARSLAIWEADARLSGKPGGRVAVQVVREGKPHRRTIEIVRSSWTPVPPSAARVEGQAVITIPDFAPGTTAALKQILSQLDKTKPLLLDLRGDAFGAFDEAARAAALFVSPGVLGELKGKRVETKTYRAEPGERVHESRLVLLVDSGTAGAAELFAAALREGAGRESGRAAEPVPTPKPGSGLDEDEAPNPPADKPGPVRLVGEPTFGMGFSAQVVKLGSGGALKLSVAKIRTARGRTLSPKGLEPDDRVFTVAVDDTSGKPPTDPVLQRGLRVLAEPPIAAKTAA
jgi:carboxyl-terminal processing protease